MLEARRLNREVEAKKKKLKEAIEKESGKDARMGGRLHGWSGWFSVVVRVQTRILQAISEWKRPVEGKEFGSVVCCHRSGVSESVELERGWIVGGFLGHFLAHRLGCVVVARMFQKTGWSERWCTRIVHAVRTLGRITMPGSHRQPEMERTIEDCRGCGKMDCGRAGWQLTFISAHLLHKGKKLENSRPL